MAPVVQFPNGSYTVTFTKKEATVEARNEKDNMKRHIKVMQVNPSNYWYLSEGRSSTAYWTPLPSRRLLGLCGGCLTHPGLSNLGYIVAEPPWVPSQ